MREITEIRFDKNSKKYVVESFDEDEGWITQSVDDIETLSRDYHLYFDKMDLDSLDDNEKELLEGILDQNHSIARMEVGDQPPDGVNACMESWDFDDMYNYNDYRIFYVTDIHLDAKISRVYGDEPSIDDENGIISQYVENIVKDFSEYESKRKLLLVGGDVSNRYSRVESFYRKLTDHIPGKHIMAILGNHELWNNGDSGPEKQSLEDIIKAYEVLFDSLYISFAENMLFAYKGGRRYFVRGDELLNATDDEIRDYVADSRITILGGIGFAGLNDVYNCDCGLYRNTVSDRSMEVELSRKFNAVYNRVLKVIPRRKVIVLTHMPISDWSDQGPNPNWIYINGHTHRNRLFLSDEKSVYSDNQIGYGGMVHLKYFDLDIRTDIFLEYPDGIHEITKDSYKDFYRYMGMSTTCNRDGLYYMVKRGSLYCFFFKSKKNLCILDGGSICKVDNQDLNYYYDNLVTYREKIKSIMKGYREKIFKLASFVKRFGGEGNIHGCIVDIDYFNHIYLNPFDGKITAYKASDIINKMVFRTVESLLESERKDLHQGYLQLIDVGDSFLPTIIDNEADYQGLYFETDIYRVSRFFYKMQQCLDCSVIRKWNDSLLRSTDVDGWNEEMRIILTSNVPKVIK